MVPGLGNDAGRLQQHAQAAETRIEPHQEVGLDPEPLGGVAVALLDAAFGVLAVAAHIPLTVGASEAGHRVGPPDDTNDQLTRHKATALRRLLDAAEEPWPMISRS